MKRFEPFELPYSSLHICVATLLAVVCGPSLAKGDVPWPMDKVTLHNGKQLEGLIEQETNQSLQMLEIRGKAKGLYGVYLPIKQSDVAKIARLSEGQRRETRKRFDEYRNRVQIEAERMDDFQLRRGEQRLRYAGEFFSLESTAPEVVVRRSIVRIEQIFAAMRQMIPARITPTRPIVIQLFGSQKEYQEFVKQRGLPIANPAVFHRPTNTIAVGQDLSQLAEQLKQIQAQLDKGREAVEKDRAEIPKALEKARQDLEKSPGTEADKRAALLRRKSELESALKRREQGLETAERRNDKIFADQTARMFAMLYHEALHAYLDNFVYPGQDYDVPRWLHEGLAQIFESSTLEGQVFQVEAPHRASLKRLQESLANVSLRDVLNADAGSFLVAHGENPQASLLNYAASWGVAHCLTFERHLVGSLAMDEFVKQDSDLDSPVSRFEALVQMPLATFETQWRAYILSLKPGAAPKRGAAR